MQAIEVKYLPPTEKRGLRLRVRAGSNGPTRIYSAEEYTPAQAAAAYIHERDWQSLPGNWVGGETREGTVFVRVFAPDNVHSDREAAIPNSTYKVYQ